MYELDKTLQRADCFKLLAACFYEPDKQLFLEEELVGKLLQSLKLLSSESVPPARRMQNYLESLDQKKLSIDHAALFVGPFELTAAPYGSVYLENRRTVMGESTVNVNRYYQEAGLSVDVKELPDHIAIELEFMYFLSIKEATAASEGSLESAQRFRQNQVDFYLYAMKPWTSKFCEAIRLGTANEFYLNLADCLYYFLTSCEQLYRKEQTAQAV